MGLTVKEFNDYLQTLNELNDAFKVNAPYHTEVLNEETLKKINSASKELSDSLKQMIPDPSNNKSDIDITDSITEQFSEKVTQNIKNYLDAIPKEGFDKGYVGGALNMFNQSSSNLIQKIRDPKNASKSKEHYWGDLKHKKDDFDHIIEDVNNLNNLNKIKNTESYQYIMNFFDFYTNMGTLLDNSKNQYSSIKFHENMKDFLKVYGQYIGLGFEHYNDLDKLEQDVMSDVNQVYQMNFTNDFMNFNTLSDSTKTTNYETYVSYINKASQEVSARANIQEKFADKQNFKFQSLDNINLIVGTLKKNASHNSRKFDDLVNTIGLATSHYFDFKNKSKKFDVTYDTIMEDMDAIAKKANAYLDYAKADKLTFGNQAIRNQKIDAVTRILEFTASIKDAAQNEVEANTVKIIDGKVQSKENEVRVHDESGVNKLDNDLSKDINSDNILNMA